MEVFLNPQERIDDLQRKGYRIIQHPDKFCFGMDAVLLSAFANAKEGETVIDLGTGTGIIPILMEARGKGNRFTALELQEESADMARRSVKLNDLEDKIEVVQGDIKEASKVFGKGSFQVVTTNPPYMVGNHGLANKAESLHIARHEVACTLEDIIRESAALLKNKGRFYMHFLVLSKMFSCPMTILGDREQQAAPGKQDTQALCKDIFGKEARLLTLKKRRQDCRLRLNVLMRKLRERKGN